MTAGSVGGAVNRAQEAIRVCQVEDGQRNLALQIEGLSGAIEQLEQRLSPVLQPSPPVELNAKSQPEEMLVQLAADYRERFKQVLSLTNRVAGMLQRLELP